MLPSHEQLRNAAYDRWERRGHGHGGDRDDWLRSEQDLLYLLNYKVVARAGSSSPAHLVGNGVARPGKAPRPVCRFCEQSFPQVRFPMATEAVADAGPALLPDGTFHVPDECGDCRRLFEESFEEDVARFLDSLQEGWAPRGPHTTIMTTSDHVTIAVFKGLTRRALACLPRGELAAFEGAIEWIGNPDHDFDARPLGPLICIVHLFDPTYPAPWAALSVRVSHGVPMPYALFFLGQSRVLIQMAVPLCEHDEELEGRETIVPRTAVPAPATIDGRRHDPIATATLCLGSPRPTRKVRLESF